MSDSELPAVLKPHSVQTPTPGDLNSVEFVEGLPHALVTLLERRYLTGYDPGQWRLEPRNLDGTRPLLKQVVALGRSRQAGECARAMPHVLTACHDPGHALLMVLHGDGTDHRLYLGGRRLIGNAARSTDDFLQAQESAFKAFFTGMQFGVTREMNETDLPDLSRLLDRGRSLCVVTGIPSGRGGRLPLDMQSLDRLVRAIGPHPYALMVVAEPLEPGLIDQTLDRCRRLRGEVHAYIRRTKTRSEGKSESESRTEIHGEEDWSKELPTYLFGMSLFLQVLGLATPLFRVAGMAVQSGAVLSNMVQTRNSTGSARQRSETRNWSDSGSVELLDANAEACDRLLQRHIERLQSARAGGWWQTAVYVVGENEAAMQSVTGALRSVCAGDASDLDPIRVIELPGTLIRPAVQNGQIWNMFPAHGDLGHPLGEPYNRLATCLNSEELAVLVNMPQQEIPGLPLRDRSEFAVSAPAESPDSIRLGWVQDATGRDLAPVSITAEALNRHIFVTGITGSGKTNTCMQILLQAHAKLGVPFLVIEPAKTEYRALSQIEALRGVLRFYSLGGTSPLPLRLNPLTPVPGIPLARHIDLLKAVFNASFPMFAGMAYILEEAIHLVFEERGWSLFDSTNANLSLRSTQDQISALSPSLEDLHDKIEEVLNRKRYSQEIHQNMGAALRSRLRSLMVGNKGMVLNTRRSIPLDELFARPAVIELQELGDDEEKAFVMALLFVMLYEYAEVRQHNRPSEEAEKLQHLTLIEEAHRLLQAPRGPHSPEIGDPRAKAVNMFTDMLAEMRALGEGFLVADQIPTKLAPEILKNSNLKIVHRLVAPDDRLAAGSCLNLNERQCRDLNNLTCGLAVLHDERIGEALLVRVEQVKGTRLKKGAVAPLGETTATDRSFLFRHAGCRECSAPCQFFHRLQQNELTRPDSKLLRAMVQILLFGSVDQAWQSWQDWRGRMIVGGNDEIIRGTLFCAATQVAYHELGMLTAARQKPGDIPSPWSPASRLERESLAAGVSHLLRVWNGTPDLTDAARIAFATYRRALQETLFLNPPDEKPGCKNCPSRCRVLPFLTAHFQSLFKPIEAVILSQQPQKNRLESARQAVQPVLRQLPNSLQHSETPLYWSELAYCLSTNAELTAASEEQRQSFLVQLGVISAADLPTATKEAPKQV